MKTTIKLQYQPSSQDNREGRLYYQLIRGRCVKQISTSYVIGNEEWDPVNQCVKLSQDDSLRKQHLISIRCCVQWDIHQLEKLIKEFEKMGLPYQLSHLMNAFQQLSQKHSLFVFMENLVEEYRKRGQFRTSETYLTTLNSFKRFRKDEDVMLEEIHSDLLLLYEGYLKLQGVSQNTICFYMHRLRAVYNRAVEQGLIEQHFPFKKVKISMERTMKRAIPVHYIRKLKNLDLDNSFSLSFARDIFLFSFYTRGMSFVDIAYLQKKDLQNGILTYRRKKTGQKLQIHWENCMQQIVHQHSAEKESSFLFSIIKDPEKDYRRQYQNALMRINRNLKKIGEQIGLPIPLTMYVARHSWATIARSEGIPLSVISEGMGHDNEKTTQIYLASIENAVVDRANRKILKLVE